MAELEGGTITLPKKVSLILAAALVVQLGWLIYQYASTQAVANGRIERLERDATRDAMMIAEINGRTIRMEVELAFIKAAIERLKH